jgi:hypothetical protein
MIQYGNVALPEILCIPCEKISSLKKEIDAIQVKEIPQGGLTQGQQSQVARNQQRIEQVRNFY